MSHSSPSGRRREGRNDFEPNLSPEEIEALNPYLPTKSWFDEFHSRDWLDGWKEAEANYIQQEKEKEEEERYRDNDPRLDGETL